MFNHKLIRNLTLTKLFLTDPNKQEFYLFPFSWLKACVLVALDILWKRCRECIKILSFDKIFRWFHSCSGYEELFSLPTGNLLIRVQGPELSRFLVALGSYSELWDKPGIAYPVSQKWKLKSLRIVRKEYWLCWCAVLLGHWKEKKVGGNWKWKTCAHTHSYTWYTCTHTYTKLQLYCILMYISYRSYYKIPLA